jgi:hypothetical protein
MWMSLTKNPMKLMMANPITVAMAIFWNSRTEIKRDGTIIFSRHDILQTYNSRELHKNRLDRCGFFLRKMELLSARQ